MVLETIDTLRGVTEILDYYVDGVQFQQALKGKVFEENRLSDRIGCSRFLF